MSAEAWAFAVVAFFAWAAYCLVHVRAVNLRRERDNEARRANLNQADAEFWQERTAFWGRQWERENDLTHKLATRPAREHFRLGLRLLLRRVIRAWRAWWAET